MDDMSDTEENGRNPHGFEEENNLYNVSIEDISDNSNVANIDSIIQPNAFFTRALRNHFCPHRLGEYSGRFRVLERQARQNSEIEEKYEGDLDCDTSQGAQAQFLPGTQTNMGSREFQAEGHIYYSKEHDMCERPQDFLSSQLSPKPVAHAGTLAHHNNTQCSIQESSAFNLTDENIQESRSPAPNFRIPDLVECSTPPTSPGELKEINVVEDISNRHLDSLEALDHGDTCANFTIETVTVVNKEDAPKTPCLKSSSIHDSETKWRPRLQKTVSWSDDRLSHMEVKRKYFSVDQLQGRESGALKDDILKDIYEEQHKKNTVLTNRESTASTTSDTATRRDSYRQQKGSSGYGTGEADEEEEEGDVFPPEEPKKGNGGIRNDGSLALGDYSTSHSSKIGPEKATAMNTLVLRHVDEADSENVLGVTEDELLSPGLPAPMLKPCTLKDTYSMSKFRTESPPIYQPQCLEGSAVETSDLSFQLSSNLQISSNSGCKKDHTRVALEKGYSFNLQLMLDPKENIHKKDAPSPGPDDQPSSFIKLPLADDEKDLRKENFQAIASNMFSNLDPEAQLEELPFIFGSADSEFSPNQTRLRSTSKSLSTPSSSSAKSKTPGSGGEPRMFSFEEEICGNLHTIPEEPRAHVVPIESGKKLLIHVEEHLQNGKGIWRCVPCKSVLKWMCDHAEECLEVRCPLQWCSFFSEFSDEAPEDQVFRLVNEYKKLLLEPFTSDMKIIKLHSDTNDGQVKHWYPITCMGKFGSAVLAVPEVDCDGKNDICYWFIKKMKQNSETIKLLKELGSQAVSAHVVQYLWAALDNELTGFMYICSCYETGHTLGDLMNAVQPSKRAPLVKFYLRQILKAADYLHQRSIVYLLWKDTNIVLDESKRIAKLSNFSAATFIGADGTEESMEDIALKLHADIAPPELLQGYAPTGKSDSWGLGCLTYHLLTGRSLLHRLRHNKPEMIRKKVKYGQIQLPDFSSVGDTVLAVLLSACLKFSRDERRVALHLISMLK